jgi:hypothetical protein
VRKLVKQKETNRLLKKTRRGLQRQRRRIRVSGSATRSTTTTSGGAEEDYLVLVRHFAGGAIWERYQQILRYEMALPRGSAETLHGLRIACKRLRYSMQIFGKTPPALAETLSALKDAQDHLGRLHDIFYAERLITELVPPSGAARRHAPVRTQAATHPHPQYLDYLEALTREGSQLRSSIGPLWRRLTGLPMRQTICGYIASL